MTDNGYVLAYRRSWSHPIFRDILDAAIWNYLYQNAAWHDTRVFKLGTRIELKRGQIFISPRELAAGFCCAEARIRRLINDLSSDAMITTLPTHRGTIITICNYDEYQPPPTTDDAQEDTPATHNSRTSHALYKDNKTNEGNERKERVRATRLPSDWILPQAWGQWAEQQGLTMEQVLRERDKFKDYWHSKAGKDAAKLDWLPTWRNWIRRSIEGARR